ncbi:MAG TPA: biotin/lipoyl-binding protein [Brevefilum fermentans]|jgi:glutaconyl-CoA/methylmalonyl-CoA decarboxylase subunit gamma|nr:biotin/lipoyl-binding protein [Brevefilum fermentans]HQA27951.1 biotin/lipoyl-binding protein [Brevefilum fermentans]
MKIEVQIDNQHYTVEIDDIHARPVIAWVQGERFEVWPEDTGSTQTGQAAMPVVSVPDVTPVAKAPEVLADGGRELTSPLPGVIVAVLVKPGDAVIRGQELCTLEAMKMKNAIRANREAVVEAVAVTVGEQVNHGQVLITFVE